MTGFASLVGIFVRDLVRRRLLWALVIVTLLVVAFNYWQVRMMEELVGEGLSFNRATRVAASQLEGIASTLRSWLPLAVVLFSAQVAPESRRNGTSQFVLSLGVQRVALAAAQFVALAAFITVGVLVLHAGFSIAGLRSGAFQVTDVALAWITLLVPLLVLAAAVFSVSMTAGSIETYLLFLGAPLVLRTLPRWLGFPRGCPAVVVRIIENTAALFPSPGDIILWPHVSIGDPSMVPRPQMGWSTAHAAFAAALWIVFGFWLLRHHDFGSRTALK